MEPHSRKRWGIVLGVLLIVLIAALLIGGILILTTGVAH